eukprot:1725734-Amphidinium_carterae.1
MQMCQTIIERLSLDAARTVKGKAIMQLLSMHSHIVIRFAVYQNYPCRCVLLSRRFNPDGHLYEATQLLEAMGDVLDAGFSRQLHREAWKDKSELMGSKACRDRSPANRPHNLR